jgi:hypothetical protein
LLMAPRGRPAPGRLPPRGIADSPSFLIQARLPLPSTTADTFTVSLVRSYGPDRGTLPPFSRPDRSRLFAVRTGFMEAATGCCKT